MVTIIVFGSKVGSKFDIRCSSVIIFILIVARIVFFGVLRILFVVGVVGMCISIRMGWCFVVLVIIDLIEVFVMLIVSVLVMLGICVCRWFRFGWL